MGRESKVEAKPGDLPIKTDQSFLRGLRNGDAPYFNYPRTFPFKLSLFEEVAFLFR